MYHSSKGYNISNNLAHGESWVMGIDYKRKIVGTETLHNEII